ncbi:uncharacterized protein LOC125220038 [Salvia hispanica]|uniref:uncharacterized protein LOC125220038 n=1 Tax=Salvia hispanica TaxID=49212 RepID=UPI00200958E4|nr:uncharacterized protein LOC125220038 [Salvia hispanica]
MNMVLFLRKNLGGLISKQNSSLCKYNVSLPLLLRNLSASPEREVVTPGAVHHVLVNKHDFSPEIASAVSSALSRFRSLQNADSILSLLEEKRFSSSQLQRIVTIYPEILAARADAVRHKIKILRDFGFSAEEIAKIMSCSNAIQHSSAEKKIIPQLATLKGMLGSNDEVIGLVKRSVWYMTVDLEKIFLPNVDFLRSCGVTTEGIRVFLHNYPRCLLLKPDLMRKAVERATEMGVDQRSKTFVHAVRAIASRSKQSLELKMQGFRDMGVSESEILVMFRRAPTAFCISLDKMKEIKSLLLATGRYEMCDLISDPSTFMCSVEKRYKPRLQVLEMLESKGLIEKWPALSSICRWTDKRFVEKFVRPYSDELGEVCGAFKGSKKSKK